jgi:uncharacterized DUF497 family protein
MAGFVYEFEWDTDKAKWNFAKHSLSFEQAAEVFRDPLALTIPDDEHSGDEVRGLRWGRIWRVNTFWLYTRSKSLLGN